MEIGGEIRCRYDVFLKEYQIKRKNCITELGLKESSSNLIPANSIIVCTRMGLGKIAINTIPVAINQDLRALIISRMNIDLRYIIAYYKTLSIRGEGTTVKGISIEELHNMLFPLPPLAEQQRIVVKVNELMSLCDELEEAEQELDALESRFEEYLPKSILQAAVQGKLVPQDIHDEPASVLLERIRAEKARLVKEGKIKKEKPLPPISEDEIPYDLPEGWVWCRLGDLGDWGAGATPLRSESRYYHNGTINWLKTGELNDGIIYESEEKITEEALNECSLRINKVGDVLIAMYGATIGKLAIVGAEMTTNQACCGCTPFTGVYNYYLFYLLKAYRKILVEKGEGGAQPNISRIKIRNLPVPLPPLAEQQRIVVKVEELMALCEEIKAVKTKPIEQRDTNKVIDFPAVKQDGQIQLAARGEISKKSSSELMQAIDEMFAGDE